jgi:putative Flp pilus-assembly TadE/G-like protein
MLAMKLRRARRSERGQIMVLGVMGVLLVAIMMLLTLNIGQSVYEKIRLQQLSDSAAFSTATLEARSYNFLAYTNRANIAGLVAGVSAHGWMSMASTVPEMFKSAGMNFLIMGIFEIGLCCSCPYCSCVQHCIHAIRDFLTFWDYMDRGDELEDNLKECSDDFIRTIKALDLHMKYIALNQDAMVLWTGDQVLEDKVTEKIINSEKAYAPGADNPGGVGAANAVQYGMTFELDADKRKWVGTEIANGSRYNEFVYDRGYGAIYTFVHVQTLMELLNDIPQDNTNGHSLIAYYVGESRVVEKGDGVESQIESSNHGPAGKALAAHDWGLIFSHAYCGVMASTFYASVGSNDGSGEHTCEYFFGINGSCCDDEGEHDDAFTCLGTDSVVVHNCFVLFKANEDPTSDFGQPAAWSVLTSDLRHTKGVSGGEQKPWEVTDSESGTVGVDLGGTIGRKEVQITNRPDADPVGAGEFGNGVALSKALVYYHLPKYDDGWKEHPNFFNPYWRGKLQPFRGVVEAGLALAAAGIVKYSSILVGGLLVEPPLP